MTKRLSTAEKWLNDGILVTHQPAFLAALEVDMSAVRALIVETKAQGTRITYLHVLVWACARALKLHPSLHRLLCGGKLVDPASADIGISITGDTVLAPVLTIERADQKTVIAIGQELASRLEETRAADAKLQEALNRFGWLVPVARVRRALLRTLRNSFEFRRKGSGTFQVSVLPNVDLFATPVFGNTAILTMGSVRERVVAVAGRPEVRTTAYLACSADHRVCDGKAVEEFLCDVRRLLETEEAAQEFAAELATEARNHNPA